jgi:hypothetical protein
MEEKGNACKTLTGKRKDHWEDGDVGWRAILRWVFEKDGEAVKTGFG